jgi:hypothetical protein
MTNGKYTSAFPRRHRARVVHVSSAPKGVGNAGRTMHPQPRVEIKIEPHERRHHGRTGITRHSRTRMVYGFLRALPGVPSLLATVDTGTGCQDHTTSPSAPALFVSQCRLRPSHPAPNVRDDRERPF